MKTIILSLAAVLLLSCNLLSQNETECTANVEALEEQIKNLATLLGDDAVLQELEIMQAEVSDEDRITLSEKDPNPYEAEQKIVLDIPEDASDVELVFTNFLGQQIKALDISSRGETSITVYMAEYLINNYNYQMVVDGTPVKS